MKMVQASPAPSHRDLARNYRELASQCREMANRSRRPGPLLLRAAAFDDAAEYQLQCAVAAPMSS
jgi:hypothetical protein